LFLACKCEDWRQKNIDSVILLCFTQGKNVNASRAKTKKQMVPFAACLPYRTMDELGAWEWEESALSPEFSLRK